MRNLLTICVAAVMVLCVTNITLADTITVTALPGQVPDEALAIGSETEYAPGWATGCWQANNTAKTNYYVTPQQLFGRDDVKISELASISYFTKKGSTHTEDASDWYLIIYTEPYSGSPGSDWYGDRINSEPYFSEDLNDPANTWNQWVTDAGQNNRLRFFDSSGGYFGSYTDPFLSDLTSDVAYKDQEIMSFCISTASGWAAGFDGYVDGLSIELTGGDIGNVNFEAVPVEVWVDDDFTSSTPGWGITHFDSIQDGIDAVQGSTVNVAAGTYIESGQIVIDKEITIIGDQTNKPVVMTDSDTGTSGDARGWFLVNAGADLTLKNMVLDGQGHKIYQAIRANGPGTLDNCEIKNMDHTQYVAFGLAFMECNWTVTNNTFSNIKRVGVIAFGSGVTDALISGNTYVGKGDGDWLDYGIEVGGGAVATIKNNTITNCTGVALVDGSTSAAILVTTYYGSGTQATITKNTLTNNTGGIAVGYDASDTSTVVARYNNISGNTDYGIDTTAPVVDAENNWWGSATGPSGVGPGSGDAVSANVDYAPWLLTDKIHMAAGAARLVELQQNDGGWDWPLYDGDPYDPSPLNTIGPIGKGLAQAYKATRDDSLLPAIEKAGDLLLSKTNYFSPPDGYLAAALDALLGGTTYVDFVNANYYGKLASGTYDHKGLGTLYDTAGYVNLIRTARAGLGNLAAWDLGMGLVGAESVGVIDPDRVAWIDGIKAEIDEMDTTQDYVVLGLAGAVYGLAFANEDCDPTTGDYESAASLTDLADILAGYQLPSGGFPSGPGDSVSTQETAYAILALQEVGGYTQQVEKAVEYLKSIQLCTGGWGGSEENNEVTAEAMWALGPWNLLELNVADASIYVQPGENVITDMDVKNLLQKVVACQAILGYSSTYLQASAGCVAAGGGVWDDLIYNSWDIGSGIAGEIDTAIGIDVNSTTTGTDTDNTVAVITLEALTEGITEIVFRPDVNDIESTMLADMSGQTVWPSKIDSQTIVIDGTPPTDLTLSADPLCTATTTDLTFSATDSPAGIDYYELFVDSDSKGAVTSVYTLDLSGYADGDHDVMIRAYDKAGNSSDSSIVTVTVDKTAPVISNIVAEQDGGSVLCPDIAIQGIVDIYVDVVDSGCADLVEPPEVLVDGITPVNYIDKSGNTFHYQIEVLATTANGSRTITVNAEDALDNSSSDSTKALCVNKNQIDGNIELELFVGASRQVTFVTNGGTKSWTPTLSFTGNVASYTLTDVPEGTTHLSAKAAWNLRVKLAAALGGDGQAMVNFTGGNELRGGDLNGTNTINILDYAVLKINWGTTNAVADITGDGSVNIFDYFLLKLNFFKSGDAQ